MKEREIVISDKTLEKVTIEFCMILNECGLQAVMEEGIKLKVKKAE